jgi:3alpha(or 20beta)-hydroxysteroid dehydrogenase
LTKTAAIELGPRGVRVNSLHPGGIATPMLGVDGFDALTEPPAPGTTEDDVATAAIDAMVAHVPLGRAGRPIEVARMALFLASDEASYCTGMEFVVDGGSVAGIDIAGRL